MLEVSIALIMRQQSLLLSQRQAGKSLAGLWEFPGGKVEAGENSEQALYREMQEELGITPIAPQWFMETHTVGQSQNILLSVWLVTHYQGQAQGREGQAVRWVTWDHLPRYEMPEGNTPILQKLLQYMEKIQNQ